MDADRGLCNGAVQSFGTWGTKKIKWRNAVVDLKQPYQPECVLLAVGGATAAGEADQTGAADEREDHDLREAGVGGRVHGASFGKN